MSVYGFLLLKYNLPMISGRSDEQWLKDSLNDEIITPEDYQRCRNLLTMYKDKMFSYDSWEEK